MLVVTPYARGQYRSPACRGGREIYRTLKIVSLLSVYTKSRLSDVCMIEMLFNSVSASEAGDYYQVVFEEDADNPSARYFLIQRQFEFPYEGFYIESDNTEFCGHFDVEAASLSRRWLRLEMPNTKWESIQIGFAADQVAYDELAHALGTMFEDRLLHAEQDA